ncbi:hypothetical protein [Streptomyces resistomycificus]|uniref:Uncharacterized protein n=1 Tax=Streptomyces resistomycificus TaxID=67356 RepID=A0A0L8LZM2_9ACTN|nr:hypothetical protein [Streptomyces resistomycificus]KOG43623.1 hypothetical protein ADK37_00350 [Streptomyces resistomycificus]KUO00195.1 hypothetical protein AQJ84_08725 [Streptomyces resistomycificus]
MTSRGEGGRHDGVEGYAHLWRDDEHQLRWVIWNTAGGAEVFDRETNCPVPIGDETVRRVVLDRMRAAGVPESDDYPGRPCA